MKMLKQDLFLGHLLTGGVFIHIDVRRPGVELPEFLKAGKFTILQYGKDMAIPIPDLRVSKKGVHATLSFQQAPHSTFIPWEAICTMVSSTGDVTVYWEDIPDDFVIALSGTSQKEAPVKGRKKTGHLKAVPLTVEDQTTTESATPVKKPRRKKFKLEVLKGGRS